MVRLALLWFAGGAAFLLAARFVPGISVSGFEAALFAALIWGVLNTVVRPLILLLALPITILTLGLFSFVVNAILFWVVSVVVPGVVVSGFLAAVLGSLLVSIIMSIAEHLIPND